MSLKNLSNQEFETRLHQLVKQERQILHLVLVHIAEADRRKLYLKRNRSSLFEYLVKDFGYSESAANRRIQAARLSVSVPALPEKIKSGQITLTQVGELARALKQVKAVTSEQKQNLVEQISGQTTAKTQQLIAKELDTELRPAEKTQVQKDESVSVQITMTQAQYAKLLKAKDLTAAQLMKQGKSPALADVMEVALDEAIEKRTKVTAAAAAVVATPTKSVTPKLRKQILQRDQKCQVCSSTFNLHIDHIKPKWAGGDNSPGNLRVLCAAHNQSRYRQQAGLS